MDGSCALCGEHKALMESHVLPAFAYRWLRDSSGKGHIRSTDNPNKRVQDGIKLYWLCGECETKFSAYETAFATYAFHPWNKGQERVPYKDWLLKFCVSISWRVLKFCRGRNSDAKYTDEQNGLMDQAERRWYAFLQDDVPHPAKFEQHLLIFDVIEDTDIQGLPSNFNRFMTRAITFDIVGSEKSLMTYAKIGKFNVFGIILKGPNKWEGTKVHIKHGLLKPGSFTIPAGLLDLFTDKANHSASAMSKMSHRQQGKIDAAFRKNIDSFAGSDLFKAMHADVSMFGVDAVFKKNETE